MIFYYYTSRQLVCACPGVRRGGARARYQLQHGGPRAREAARPQHPKCTPLSAPPTLISLTHRALSNSETVYSKQIVL